MYSNDSALDIKGTFKLEYEQGKNIEEIEEIMKKKFRFMLEDEEDAPSFWCILADLEWKYGVLTDKTKKIVLDLLEKGGDVEFWRENEGEHEANKRKVVLDKLEEKIKSPPPPKKRIPKKRPYVCKWNIGDVFAYKLTQKDSENTEYYGSYVVFQVVDKYKNIYGNTMPHVHIYKKIFNKVPNMEQLIGLPFLIINDVLEQEIYIRIYELGFYTLERSRSFKKENLYYIGSKEINTEIYKNLTKLEEKYNYSFEESIDMQCFDISIMRCFDHDIFYNNYEIIVKMELYQYKLYKDKISEKIRSDYKKLFAKGIELEEIEKILYDNYIPKLNNDNERLKRIIYDNKYRSGNITDDEKKYMFSYLIKEKLERNIKLKKENNILSNAKKGDIFAYRLNSKIFEKTKYYNKYIIIQKYKNYTNYINESKPHIRIYEKIFDYIPNIQEIKKNLEIIKYMDLNDAEKMYPLPIFCKKDKVEYDLYINMNNKNISDNRIFKIGNFIQDIFLSIDTYYNLIPEAVNIENFDTYIKELLEYNNIVKEKIKNDNIDICSTL